MRDARAGREHPGIPKEGCELVPPRGLVLEWRRCYSVAVGRTVLRSRVWPERLELVRELGTDSLAYSVLQPDMSYFDTAEGFVATRKSWNGVYVLGEPICPLEAMPGLLEAFFEEWEHVSFLYASESFSFALNEWFPGRFSFQGLGVDKLVDLAPGALEKSKKVQSAVKKAKKAKLVLEEVSFDEIDHATRSRLLEINDDYLSRKKGNEVSFLSREAAFVQEPDVRTFLIRVTDEIIGFIALDPYYERRKVKGYLLNQIRFGRTKLWGVYFSVVHALAQLLRAEGVPQLSLGGCPLHKVNTSECLPESWQLSQLAELARRIGNKFHAFEHLCEIKDAIPGVEGQRYFASNTRFAIARIPGLLRVIGVV